MIKLLYGCTGFEFLIDIDGCTNAVFMVQSATTKDAISDTIFYSYIAHVKHEASELNGPSHCFTMWPTRA